MCPQWADPIWAKNMILVILHFTFLFYQDSSFLHLPSNLLHLPSAFKHQPSSVPDACLACLAINTIQVCLSCQFKQMPLTPGILLISVSYFIIGANFPAISKNFMGVYVSVSYKALSISLIAQCNSTIYSSRSSESINSNDS